MRNQGGSPFLSHQRVGTFGREREYAGALFGQRSSLDPIEMLDGGMS